MEYLHWNISPEIVRISGPFGIRWYSLFFLTGILLGHHFFGKMLAREQKDVELRDPLLTYIFLGTIVGARLGHCLFYNPGYYFQNPLEILKTWEGGLASHGGFTGVAISLYFFNRNYAVPGFLWLADRICILAIFAGASIRLGNFFNSEIIGLPTTVPWAVIFERVDTLPRHPTQLYEAVGYATIAALLYLVYLKRAHLKQFIPGSLFGLALTLGFGFRFCIEFLKENQVDYAESWTFNTGQWLSIPFVILGALMLMGLPQQWLCALKQPNSVTKVPARKASPRRKKS